MQPPRPMLAGTGTRVPRGDAWVHEVKWDGVRVLADVRDGRLRLWARSGNEVTAAYPELAGLADAYDDMLLDGEVVALDGGRPSFSALAHRMHVRDARKAQHLAAVRPVTFMVFDLLRLFGSDLTGQPWSARRELLDKLALDSRQWQVPPVYDDGATLFAATREQGLEGIVSKRRSSPYLPGRRSEDWVKLPHRAAGSYVVGGWRPELDTASGKLGAVLVGRADGVGGWEYAGRVGSGLAGKVGAEVARYLKPLARGDSPFSTEVPREDATGAVWVEPTLVVDVRALGVGASGKLRQPSFQRVRADLCPADLQETGDA